MGVSTLPEGSAGRSLRLVADETGRRDRQPARFVLRCDLPASHALPIALSVYEQLHVLRSRDATDAELLDVGRRLADDVAEVEERAKDATSFDGHILDIDQIGGRHLQAE